MRRAHRTLLLATAPALLLAAPAFAQTAPPATASDEDELTPGETIIVTGTRRTDRTVADSSVPVDVISSEALTNSGFTETNKILNTLVPSFNFPQPSIADGTDVLRPATLRGLSPDQVLVLINGKRRHVSALLNINGTIGRGSAAVDLNLIPALAIERIEVLRDGASSQYGSDAIAGVINIQLKRADNGGRAVASYGKFITTLEDVANFGGLQVVNGQPVLDPADNRYFLANSDGERKARDGDTTTFAANFGVPLGAGFLNLTAEYRERDDTNRAGFDLRPNYNRPTAAFDPRELTFNRLQFRFGDAKTDDFNFIANAALPIGEVFEIYAFGSYGIRDGLSAANYRSANAAANRDFSTIAPGTTPNAANFSPLTPDGFLPFIATELEDYAGTIGVRGEIAGFNADLSASYGDNAFDYRVENSLNTSFGPASIRAFDAGGLGYDQLTINLGFVREFDFGFAGPLSIAFGGEYREEGFQIRPGEFQSFALGPFFQPTVNITLAECNARGGVVTTVTGLCSFPGRQAGAGAQGFPGIPPASATDVSRDSYAAYIEFDAELFTGFTATVAGRYEEFSDFGDTVNGKLALRYEFTDGFALRGSISNGFRAPSLHQQFFTTTSTNFVSGVPVDISTVAVGSPIARALGSQDLDPEKSINISVGATANPFRGLNLTFDYYNIKIDDRIVLTENLGASGTGTAAQRAAIGNILTANGFPSVGAARFFINGIDTTTQGFDAIATYRFGLDDFGDWTLTAAFNYNETEIDRRFNNLGPLAQIPGLLLFGREQSIRFTDGQPKDKLVLSADGEIGAFGITARTTRYGRAIATDAAAPLADPQSVSLLGPDDQILSAKFITDLELRYKLLDRFELAVGANNLLDEYPDRRPFGRRPDGGLFPQNFQYIPFSGASSPFGFNGRFVYARASVDF